MPWTISAKTIPFSRIAVVSAVPSESGVFGILVGDCCLMVGENWNLKAHLLDLIRNLPNPEQVSVVYEVCPEHERAGRAAVLQREFVDVQPSRMPEAVHNASGITFWLSAYTKTWESQSGEGPEI